MKDLCQFSLEELELRFVAKGFKKFNARQVFVSNII